MNPTLSGLIAIALWSLFGVLFIYVKALPPFEILTIVFILGYAAFTAVQMARNEDIKSYWCQPVKYYLFWLSGAGLYTILIYTAFKFAPIFEANILNYLWPILLVVFSAMIARVRLPLYRIAGLLMGFIGAALMFLPERSGFAFGNFGWGHLLAAAAGVCWALYSAFTRKYLFPVGFQAPVFLIFAGICLVIHLIFEQTVMPNAMQWTFLLLLSVSRISYVLWDYGMKHGNVTLLASVSYFLPLISSVLLMVFGEKPGQPEIALSAVLVIAGCLIVNANKIREIWVNKTQKVVS